MKGNASSATTVPGTKKKTHYVEASWDEYAPPYRLPCFHDSIDMSSHPPNFVDRMLKKYCDRLQPEAIFHSSTGTATSMKSNNAAPSTFGSLSAESTIFGQVKGCLKSSCRKCVRSVRSLLLSGLVVDKRSH
jgi:hypothetical protein